MSNRKLIRNISAVSLGAVALALCSLPRHEDSESKRMPMPSPEDQGAKKQQAPERVDIPKPTFGIKAKAPEDRAKPTTAANDTAVAEPVMAPPAAQPKPAAPVPEAAPSEMPKPAIAPPLAEVPAMQPVPVAAIDAPPATEPAISAAMDEPEPLAQIAAETAVPEPEHELEAAAISPAPVVPVAETPAPAVALPVSEQAAAAVAEAPPVPFGDPIDQSEDRSTVKVWDFATGVPINPVTPAYQRLEANDNGEAVPDATTELGAEPVAAPALEASRADPAVPAATPEETDPLEMAVAPQQQVSADLLPAGVETSKNAHSEPEPATDTAAASEEIDAPQSSSAQGRTRVWDFATGEPLHPVTKSEKTGAMAAAPQVESAPQTEVPAAKAVAAAKNVDTVATPKARVWDFATGKPLYEDPASPPDAATATEAAAAATPPAPLAIAQAATSPAPPAIIQPAGAALAQRAHSGEPLVISPQDELILEVKVKGVDASDTIIAYGTPDGVFLPLGTMARILDLALTVSDDGHYAHGWLLEEDRVLSIDLRQGILEFEGRKLELDRSLVAAFEGEMYLHVDQFARFLPIEIKADLRSMAVLITTLQPFPFELRAQREAQRKRLEARQGQPEGRDYERVDLPWEAVSVPAADIEVRAVSDSGNGPRIEGDLRLAGDLGYLTAEAFLSGETENGLTASLLELGRVDPDGELLGPLKATAFSFGDVSTENMPLGLRSVSGRGFNVTNAASQLTSVFDRVDLRGILPTGYEVELYRNDVLISSTREAVNGQYEFLQVPVDFGLNVFRLVFYGPQGQRSESVRRISVGDGRVAKGKLVYDFGAAQRDRNLLGVTPPDFIPPREYGEWRAGGQLAYGVSEGLTALLSGAWFERGGEAQWVSSTGIRTSVKGLAVKGDVGIADGGATAFAGGIGGRFGASALTLSHTEYTGLFPDETKFIGLQFLRRATEVDFNTTLKLGNEVSGLVVPLSARLRNYAGVDGRDTLQASLRASTRTSGLLLSNTLDYTRTSSPDFEANARLFGNFDLTTLGSSDTRARFALGYQLSPTTKLTSAGLQVDHALDERTSLRGSASYDFTSKSPTFGASAVREFERFSLAFDSNYSFANDNYYVGLRLGFSLGRDPLSKRMFVARPGQATSGGATLRAFQDLDGDGTYGPRDRVLPEVDFIAFNQTASTDDAGIARVAGLGTGRGVGIQIDPTSLPDITLAPAKAGIEVVPRAGRFHAIDYPVVALSEIEGTVSFVSELGAKGVSGVKLTLADENGKIVGIVKTELDGYYFFERVLPGKYRVSIEPGQASRLNLCPLEIAAVSVGFESDVITRDLEIRNCESPEVRIAQTSPDQQGPVAEVASASR